MTADKLHVEFESTPAAWCAYYDPESYIGRGNTREDAIIDLMEQEIDGSATREAKLKRALAEETQKAEKWEKRAREESARIRGMILDAQADMQNTAKAHREELARRDAYAGRSTTALRNLLAQVEKFCEEQGEADFYTGEAIAVLAQGYPGSGDPKAENAALQSGIGNPSDEAGKALYLRSSKEWINRMTWDALPRDVKTFWRDEAARMAERHSQGNSK